MRRRVHKYAMYTKKFISIRRTHIHIKECITYHGICFCDLLFTCNHNTPTHTHTHSHSTHTHVSKWWCVCFSYKPMSHLHFPRRHLIVRLQLPHVHHRFIKFDSHFAPSLQPRLHVIHGYIELTNDYRPKTEDLQHSIPAGGKEEGRRKKEEKGVKC